MVKTKPKPDGSGTDAPKAGIPVDLDSPVVVRATPDANAGGPATGAV